MLAQCNSRSFWPINFTNYRFWTPNCHNCFDRSEHVLIILIRRQQQMNKQDSFWLVQKFVMIHDSEFMKPYGEQLLSTAWKKADDRRILQEGYSCKNNTSPWSMIRKAADFAPYQKTPFWNFWVDRKVKQKTRQMAINGKKFVK